MTDKSPRQTMTKKSGKTLKEKRAAKQLKKADTGIVVPEAGKRRGM